MVKPKTRLSMTLLGKLALREAENSQILADVGAMKLTPEQLAQFLQLAASGKLPMAQNSSATNATPVTATEKENDKDEYEESEDFEDEEN